MGKHRLVDPPNSHRLDLTKVTLASSLPLLNGGVIKVPWIAHMVRVSVIWSYLHNMVMFYGKVLNGNVHSNGSKGKEWFLF